MMEQDDGNGNGNGQTVATLCVVKAFNAAFAAGDVDAIMALMTEDCVFENTYPPPDGNRLVGQDAVRAVWEGIFGGPGQGAFEWEEIFACGDRGAVRWIYRWDDGAGNAGHIRGCDILTVRNGKVAEKLSYVKG